MCLGGRWRVCAIELEGEKKRLSCIAQRAVKRLELTAVLMVVHETGKTSFGTFV